MWWKRKDMKARFHSLFSSKKAMKYVAAEKWKDGCWYQTEGLAIDLKVVVGDLTTDW